MYEFHKDGTLPPKDEGWIFVFGSNESGRHGAGAAKEAVNRWGAEYGKGVGLHGHSYAIPTKDHKIQTLPLGWINLYVNDFLIHAEHNQNAAYWITRVGCGLAGLKDFDMAMMFRGAPKNCNFPNDWARWVE
jgi:hypothetical protein